MVTLQLLFSWDTNIFMFFRSFREIHLFYKSPCNQFFWSYFFRVPDHPANSLAIVHELVYNHTSGHFFFQTQWTSRYTAWSSATWKLFIHCCPSETSDRGYSASAVHFWVMSAFTHIHLKTGSQFCLLLSIDHRKFPHAAVGAGWERKASVAGMWTIIIWATYCNYLCHQGLFWLNHVYTSSISWWRVPLHTQLKGLVDQITSSL